MPSPSVSHSVAAGQWALFKDCGCTLCVTVWKWSRAFLKRLCMLTGPSQQVKSEKIKPFSKLYLILSPCKMWKGCTWAFIFIHHHYFLVVGEQRAKWDGTTLVPISCLAEEVSKFNFKTKFPSYSKGGKKITRCSYQHLKPPDHFLSNVVLMHIS